MSSETQQSNGRWSEEEHQLFIQGLQQYGKNWKLIEKLIKTRTGSQIRSHAQKYYLKMQKQTKSDKGGEKTYSTKKRKVDYGSDLDIKIEDGEPLPKSSKKLKQSRTQNKAFLPQMGLAGGKQPKLELQTQMPYQILYPSYGTSGYPYYVQQPLPSGYNLKNQQQNQQLWYQQQLYAQHPHYSQYYNYYAQQYQQNPQNYYMGGYMPQYYNQYMYKKEEQAQTKSQQKLRKYSDSYESTADSVEQAKKKQQNKEKDCEDSDDQSDIKEKGIDKQDQQSAELKQTEIDQESQIQEVQKQQETEHTEIDKTQSEQTQQIQDQKISENLDNKNQQNNEEEEEDVSQTAN